MVREGEKLMIREDEKHYWLTAAVALGILIAIFTLVFFTGTKEDSTEALPEAQTETEEIVPDNMPPGDPMVIGSGPTTVEIFADPSCDGCSRMAFEHGQEITNAVADGKVTLKYHLLDLDLSDDDYSERANAAIRCSQTAEPELAARMAGLVLGMKHNGSPTLSNEDLAGVSKGLVGLPSEDEECIVNGDMIETARAASEKSRERLAATGSPGVPTVLVDDVFVDVTDSNWLSDALA